LKVGVIDYGVGNLGSVSRALEEVLATPIRVDRALDLHQSDALLLPGVGSFKECKQILDQGGWTQAIQDEVKGYGKPLLGICLGMQLLADSGEEGSPLGQATPGLGFIPGRVVSLRKLGCKARLPHVGWNSVSPLLKMPLLEGIPKDTDFYFVHSYGFLSELASVCVATTTYEVDITAVVNHGRVWGTQFHPEKSSKAGLKILHNFVWGSEC
jgi:imidazole glycerol-phosphate synthase subunit HisH